VEVDVSIWNKISDATKVPGHVADAVKNPGGAFKAPKWFGPYMFVGIVLFLGWAVWSGAAEEALRQFEARLLSLVPLVAVILVILAMLGVLVGWTLMKAPAGHFLAVYGRRLVWVAPVALVVGAAIVPVALAVITVANDQTTKLAAAYLGTKPAANLCQAAGLPSATPPTPGAR
jgi:hypothetical protein